MMAFFEQLKWQFILLHKNSIIIISFSLTAIYGGILYFIKDVGNLDVVLISVVLSDPSVIGYFFIALSIYGEIKHQILPAIFTTPINIHLFLISKTLSLSIIGWLCALGLAFFVKGMDYSIFSYSLGAFGICLISTLFGIIALTFADEFLKFAMLSVPFFVVLIYVPMLQYLGAFDLGVLIKIFPIQGCLDLLEYAISGKEINMVYAYSSLVIWTVIFYYFAHKLFINKVVHQ